MSADEFELLPPDDAVSPDDALAAAAAGALADPDVPIEVVVDPPEPFGRTPAFDFEAGRFIRRGGAPAWVTGFEALEQWCLMAANSARGAHRIFSDEFGTDNLNAALGTTGPEAVEAADDALQALREAWLVHDRIAEVEGDAEFDPVAGVVLFTSLYVVTDEDAVLPFPDLRLNLTTTEA